MSGLRLYLFGTPRLERGGESLHIGRRKGLAILAYVALCGQSQNREALATLFWPDFDQSRALANLRRELSRLKKQMDDSVLLADRTEVTLAADAPLWVDVLQFRDHLSLLAEHAYHFPEEPCVDCHNALTEAVALHTERFLAGFNLPDAARFDEWHFFEAESLGRDLASSLQTLIRWHESVEDYATAIEFGRRWLALDTLHEPAHRSLMALYARAGQQSAVLRQYDECVRLLDEELDIEPEPETVALYKAIRARRFPPAEPQAPAAEALITPSSTPSRRYVLEEQIAISGQGEVFRGLDTVQGTAVIIKRLPPALAVDEARVARFIRESRALSYLDHPNIVQMLDTFVDAGHHHIVMEYVAGGSLADRLHDQGPLPVEEVLDLALELADALARAHHLGIIHRDLKPGNVLLTERGAPRLSDFGTARLEQEDVHLTDTGALVGSPAYMSPEALRGATLDARSDIWSFGVLLYELLAGQRPFEGESISQILVGILTEPVPDILSFREDLPPRLVALITQMLAKLPAARPASARQVAAELEAIQAGTRERGGRLRQMNAPSGERQEVESALPVASVAPPAPIRFTAGAVEPLVGREKELAQIEHLLIGQARARLLTIVGPGGMGKTRLAQAVRERVAPRFRDGAVFLPLAPLTSPEQIGPALAALLGLEYLEAGEDEALWLTFLAQREQLLVLDNFEHLLEDVSLVALLLKRAPGLTILVTSREPLNLSAEVVFRLDGLSYPEALIPENVSEYGAVALLLQQIRRHRKDLAPGLAEMVQLVKICRAVNGAPLALVLAASWAEMLTLEEIAVEIAGSLDLLTAEIRDLPHRQQSMRAVFNASWEMLDETARLILARLSIFRGSFSRSAAQAVADCSLHPLRTLMRKSWLQRRDDQLEMHELVRQYAGERLQAQPEAAGEARDAHAAYYTTLLNQQNSRMRGPEQQEAFGEVQRTFTQVSAAWRWLVQQGQLAIVVTRLLPALYRYCEGRARAPELFPLLALALESPEAVADNCLRDILLVARAAFLHSGQSVRFESPDDSIPFYWKQNRKALEQLQPAALPPFWQVVFSFSYGRMVDCEKAIERLEALVPQLREAGQAWLLAFSLQHLALLRQLCSGADVEAGEASGYLLEALEIMERLGDIRESGYTLRALGQLHLIRQELPEAIIHWREALTLLQQADSWVVATQLHWLIGDAYLQLGEVESAFHHYRKMSESALAHQHRRFATHLLSKESYEAARYGRWEHALQTRRQALELAQATDEQIVKGWYIWEMGELQRLLGEAEEALVWFERAAAIFNEQADSAGRCFYYRGLADVARARGDVEVARSCFERSLALAAEAGHQWAVAYAEAGLALTMLAQGEQDEAVDYALRAVVSARASGDRAILLAALLGAAEVLLDKGRVDSAVALAAFVVAHPVTWREIQERAGQLLARQSLPPERMVAARVQARQRQLEDVVAEVQRALAGLQGRAGSAPAAEHSRDTFILPFVGREKELSWLDEALSAAVAGRGQVCFLTGPAGQGKSTLLHAFILRAQQRHPRLVAVTGHCNAYTGQGDPYLPFREILQRLTGDVAENMTDRVPGPYTTRLGSVMWPTVEALLDVGPHLLESFLPARPLLQRVSEQMSGETATLSALESLAEAATAGGRSPLKQSALFAQYSSVLEVISRRQPLLLCIDDLQWSDRGSARLLLHLSKRLRRRPILIVGAYRPAEVVAAWGSERHPLQKVVPALQREFGPILLDLAKSEGRRFVDALLDAEPNRLDERFRSTLATLTQGHPLFTVELLRGMHERGELQQSTDGAWIASSTLAWQTVPARVEGAIGARIDRLKPSVREQLQMASVIGETFTLELLARLSQTDSRDLAGLFSQELDRTHQLVQAVGISREGELRLARYRFRHILIQRYLYQSMDEVERVYRHEAVAEALEALYGSETALVATDLARHFTAAHLPARAAPYHRQAGDQAWRGAAVAETMEHYQNALATWREEDYAGQALLQERLGECAWLTGQLLTAQEHYQLAQALYLDLGRKTSAGAIERVLGRLHWEQGDRQAALDHYQQALTLLEEGPETVELAWVYSSISQMHVLAWEHEEAVTWGERALALARRLSAPDVLSHALNNFCGAFLAKGKAEEALALLREAKALALAHQLPHEGGRTYYNLAGTLISVDRYEETWTEFHEMLQHGRRWLIPYYAGGALAELATLEWFMGRWRQALLRLPEIGEWLQSGESLTYLEILNNRLLADIANTLGRPQAALSYLEQSAQAVKSKDESQTSLPYLREKLRALTALSRREEAGLVVERMIALTASGFVVHYSSLGPLGAGCCWAAAEGQWAQAKVLLGHIAEVRSKLSSPSAHATEKECRGMMAMHQERAAEASGLLQEGAQIWRQVGRPYDEARVRLNLALALRAEGHQEEAGTARARAVALLETLAEQLDDDEARENFRGSPMFLETIKNQGSVAKNSA